MRLSLYEKYNHILAIFNDGCGDMKHKEFATVKDPKAQMESVVNWAKDLDTRLKGTSSNGGGGN